MRYQLTDYEWTAIKPVLPNKPRDVPRVDDRRVLNGIFWALRSGAPWRDLPASLGPHTTYYNRFVRWRRAGVWDQILDALTTAHDAAVQMIDTSIVRRHRHGACIAGNREQLMGRSRGGLMRKIHTIVDTKGLPVRLALTTGEAHDNRLSLPCCRTSSLGQWCSLIVDTTLTGSRLSPAGTARRPISRKNGTVANRFLQPLPLSHPQSV